MSLAGWRWHIAGIHLQFYHLLFVALQFVSEEPYSFFAFLIESHHLVELVLFCLFGADAAFVFELVSVIFGPLVVFGEVDEVESKILVVLLELLEFLLLL